MRLALIRTCCVAFVDAKLIILDVLLGWFNTHVFLKEIKLSLDLLEEFVRLHILLDGCVWTLRFWLLNNSLLTFFDLPSHN